MLTFELITPEGTKISEEVYEVRLPTSNGEIGILPHHIPLISIATIGVVSIRKNKSDTSYEHVASSGGVIQISGTHVRLLANTAERANDIDELKAKEALERALEAKRTASDHVAIADATRLIERNLVRLKVAELKRRKNRSREY